MPHTKFEVSICGGGVGGVILAITLGKYSSIPIHVYEAQSTIGTIGAGVGLWPRVMNVFRDLGVHDDIVAISSLPSPDVEHVALNRISDSVEEGYDWYHDDPQQSTSPYHLHRQALMDVLQRHLPKNCVIHLNKRLTHYTEDEHGGFTLYFEDGTTSPTQVLVGADGQRSPTRKSMFECAAQRLNDPHLRDFKDSPFSGLTTYRALFPTSKLLERYPNHPVLHRVHLLCGYKKQIVAYTVNGGKMVNFVGFAVRSDPHNPENGSRSSEDVPGKEVVDAFEGYEPIAHTLAECCESETVKLWSLYSVGPLPFWTRGNVAILGDAAHSMLPHLASGAGQAIEDAWLLGRLLADDRTTLATLPAVLSVYERVRKPLAEYIVSRSAECAWVSTFCAPEQLEAGDKVRSPANLQRWAANILRGRDEVADQPSVSQQWAEAEGLLRDIQIRT